jgi:hypothetical protein
MKKALIAMQYWAGDAAMAERVTRFMADLMPERRQDITLALVRRRDCPAPKPDWVSYLAKKADVLVLRTSRFGSGWPHGPNEMWFDLAAQFWQMQMVSTKGPRHEFMLTFEPDDVPLYAEWIDMIYSEWLALGEPPIMGDELPFPVKHINGNLLLSGAAPKLEKIARLSGCPPNVGWDAFHAGTFRKIGALPCKSIRSLWQTKTMHPLQIHSHRMQGHAVLHGVKDDSVLAYMQRIWLSKALGDHISMV